jgi:hypothetical protein
VAERGNANSVEQPPLGEPSSILLRECEGDFSRTEKMDKKREHRTDPLSFSEHKRFSRFSAFIFPSR